MTAFEKYIEALKDLRKKVDDVIAENSRVVTALGDEVAKLNEAVEVYRREQLNEPPRCASCENLVKGEGDTKECSACGGK